jgi:hypothetical protein
MADGIIMLLDDEEDNVKSFVHAFSQLDIELELKPYTAIEDFRRDMCDETIKPRIKAIIFDLVQNKKELGKDAFAVSEDIKKIFDTNRIPIFIHSAYLERYHDFEGKGTIFKIPKSGTSVAEICEKLKLFYESDFLNIFCPGGIIENAIMNELHNAFINQFYKDDIENIIKAIKGTGGVTYSERVIDVFKRISVRALMSRLVAPYFNEDGQLEQRKLNAAEHYVRRISDFKIWTGDIFEKKDESEKILILTPRCDIASKNKTNILACRIIPGLPTTKEEMKKAMVDNVRDKKYRYLPKTPLFEGGKVDLSTHMTIPSGEILTNYCYLISLSDELTNEITGKLCSYFMRTGISEIDEDELIHFFKCE